MTDRRRSLLDDDGSLDNEMNDIFGDEFEVEDFDGMADGFRHGQPDDVVGEEVGEEDVEDTLRSESQHYAPGSAAIRSLSRNSMRKSRPRDNPFTSEEVHGGEAPLHRTPSGNFAPVVHRSLSSTSSRHYAGTGNSRFGAGGLNHPYDAYAQNTVARTPSVASASMARPLGVSTSQRGPQHPYAMYPQGVSEDLDDEEEEETVQSQVPLGFMGLGQRYRRRRGPDGEEQDIVGGYGHTEQLPPYTRYPEDGPEKAPLLPIPDAPTALHSRAPVLGTDPAMPLMHDQPQPTVQRQSMMDESDLIRQASRVSRPSTHRASSVTSSADVAALHKTWSEKSWTEKRRTRFCGLALIWWMAFGLVVAFVGVVVGGVYGGYVQGRQTGDAIVDKATPTTSLYDASLITTTASTSPPTGTFALAFGAPQETQAQCLTFPSQRSAWQCDFAFGNDVAINIYSPLGTEQTGAELYAPGQPASGSGLTYGNQANLMSSTWSPFIYVIDNDNSERGPAFYFQSSYDKVVVIPGYAINASVSKLKRDTFQIPPKWFANKQLAAPGEKPWMCYWNSTFLEGFIYTNEHAQPFSSITSSLATWTHRPSTTAATSTGIPSYPTPSAAPGETITTTVTVSSTAHTFTGAASAYPSWFQSTYPDWNGTDEYGSHQSKRDGGGWMYGPGPGLPIYPYMVKIEERRVPGSPQPFCVLYQILNDGSYNWVPDDNGEQIIIHLSEHDPDANEYKHGSVTSGKRLAKRDDELVPNGCHCQWLSGA